MRCLLDTHIVLQLLTADRKLGRRARHLIERADEVLWSQVSLFEVAIKCRIGHLRINPVELVELAGAAGLAVLPLRDQHLVTLATLPMYHRDPFDGLLVAQAISETLQLLTADEQLPQYSPLVVCI